ncbi:MAG: hypothetical protein K6F93_08565 [Lachnospiraceae bacterium]|nr:hypothetical protein [Lachnospiraceae bacterium]
MSQQKVDKYKLEKAGRKAAQKRKKLFNVLYVLIALIVVACFGFIIYQSTKTVYDVNVEDSKFDDVALASVLGYSGVDITDYIDSNNETSDAELDESLEIDDTVESETAE